ncbi:MAG: FAD-dependent monooxygenase [Hyphomicrobium sp.]
MTTPADRPILIAGGGIGGLAAALALAKRGIASHVLERRDAYSEEGAGIQIGPNGTRILMDIGASDALRTRAAVPDALQVCDAVSGAPMTRLPLGEWIAARHGAPYWTAHRQDLHSALLEIARTHPAITLSTGATVEGAEQQPGGVIAALADGRRLESGALIAADGLWSPVRTKLFDPAQPRAVGKSAYRSVVAIDALPKGLAVNDVHIWLTAGAHIVHYPVRGGQELAIVAIFDEPRQAAGWSTAVEAAFVRTRAAKLASPIRTLFDAANTWKLWSLQALAMPARWTQGHIALLGDAAHPVLPFLAQGAVLALEDASVLSAEIAGADGAMAAALQRYGEMRRGRALRVQSASRRNGRIYHLNGLMAAARDSVLRRAPPALIMKQYDWLYGWHSNAGHNGQ